MNALHQSKSNEHYTPRWIINAVYLVMNPINLDPASTKISNDIVCAETYFTKGYNGLTNSWFGNVWLNPPYGRQTSKWIEKLLHEYRQNHIDQAVLLVNATPDRTWFHALWEFPICFFNKRIHFLDPFGKEQKNPTHGHCLVYLPKNKGERYVATFHKVFSLYGHVVIPWKNQKSLKMYINGF